MQKQRFEDAKSEAVTRKRADNIMIELK